MKTAWAEFSLHPPVAFSLEDAEQRYRCLLPFGSGTCDMKLGDAPLLRRRMRANSITFIEPGLLLHLRAIEPMELLVISIDPDRVRRLAETAAVGRSWLAHNLIDHRDPGLAALGVEVRRTLLSDTLRLPAYLQSLADAITARLLCHFLGEVNTPMPAEALSPAVLTRILGHIEAHLAERLTVERLAGMANLSRSHFSRAFQEMTGDPPLRFILKRRICRARDLLSSDNGSLAEVAARIGFSSQAHLSSVFRKEVKTTPARYRASFRLPGRLESDYQ